MQTLASSRVACRPAALAAVRPVSCRVAGIRSLKALPSRAAAVSRKQASVRANAVAPGGGDFSVSADTLGKNSAMMRNLAFGSFWVQLPLVVVSSCILFFAAKFSAAPADVSRVFTFVGIVCAFLSTFFAHGFLTLARQALNEGKAVKRSFLVSNLVRNININLAGVGVVLVGLQASVGTLVSKTMLGAANAPYAAPQPGATLVSLDVFSLQASTNVLLAHFMSIVFNNLMIAYLNRGGASAQAA